MHYLKRKILNMVTNSGGGCLPDLHGAMWTTVTWKREHVASGKSIGGEMQFEVYFSTYCAA